MAAQEDQPLDCFILGAGPAGAAAAIALKRAGIERLLLADRPRPQRTRIGESASPAIGPLLHALGLDPRLDRLGHRVGHGYVSCWGSEAPLAADFFRQAAGPGWHLDRRAFDSWLREAAVAAGAQLLSPARLLSVNRADGLWHLGLEGEGKPILLSTRWVLDASGRSASLARRLGARLQRHDHLIALACPGMPQEAGFQGFSLVEAAAYGWWYAARSIDGRATLALMTDADLARAQALHRPAAFHAAWAGTQAIRRFALPKPGSDHAPARISAATQFLDRACGEGWLALGDALMAFDPLSASGLTGALEDAMAAARLVVAALGDDLAGRREAAAYARRARATIQGYLAARQAIYGREQRWAGAPFWLRRIAAPATLYYSHPSQMPAA